MALIVEDKGCDKGCGYLSAVKPYGYEVALREKDSPGVVFVVLLRGKGDVGRFVCRRGGRHKVTVIGDTHD